MIAREIVEDLGGRLEIKSNPGEGTVAEVVLPRSSGASDVPRLNE